MIMKVFILTGTSPSFRKAGSGGPGGPGVAGSCCLSRQSPHRCHVALFTMTSSYVTRNMNGAGVGCCYGREKGESIFFVIIGLV